MTDMMLLYVGMAALLMMAVAVLVLPAMRRRRPEAGQQRLVAQQNFFRQRQQELQTDFANGIIDESQLQELETDLKRQLVSETDVIEPSANNGNRVSLVIAALLIPVVAIGLYYQLGYQADLKLRIMQRQIVETDALEPSQWRAFEAQLDKALARRPDSAEHLAMMASLRRQAGDFAGAEPYYRRLLDQFPNDANLMAQLAQARYLANQRQLDEESRALLKQALSLEPNQATALGVLGIDAFARQDYLLAISYWQKLLPGLPPTSSEAAVISQGLAAAKSRAAEAGTLEGIRVTVTVSAALGAVPDGALFVVAKSDDGMPMPVAALRQRVGADSFPAEFLLSDGDVIRAGKTLADFDTLLVSAHISRAGTAIRQSGDWTSEAQVLTKEGDQGLELQINQRVP